MPAKVFLSCGQGTTEEKDFCKKLESWFKETGFNPYVAINDPVAEDLNKSVIQHLKNSDYFLFINFARERLEDFNGKITNQRRGSVYTNQELAIAYAMDFDDMLLFNQKGVIKEGILKYLRSNTIEFETKKQLFRDIKLRVTQKWLSDFSRQLIVKNIRFNGDIDLIDKCETPNDEINKNGTRIRKSRFFCCEISNARPDKAAFATICNLKKVEDSNNRSRSFKDDGNLKFVSRSNCYETMIHPQRSLSIDLFTVSVKDPRYVYLVSNRDFSPRDPIISEEGRYKLTFEIAALDFPFTCFQVLLNIYKDRPPEQSDVKLLKDSSC